MKISVFGVVAMLSVAGIARGASIQNGFSVANKLTPINRDKDIPAKTMIVRFNIENDRVVDSTIIYSLNSGKKMRAKISFDGEKIAFCAPSHLMVMDADGKNLRELTKLSEEVTRADNRMLTLDWPKGDFIYFRSSKSAISRYSIVTSKEEVFIDYGNDTAGNPHSMRKWACNLSGNKIAVQDGMCNMLHTSPFDNFAWGENCDPPGCNIGISASGNYVNWFTGTGHAYVHCGSWDGTNAVQKLGTFRNDSMSAWYGNDIGRGMDWPLWSANSDKWMCLQVKREGRFAKTGSNHVLFNWVDSIIIPASHHSDPTVTFLSGDLWIRPPAGKEQCYETAAGAWVPVEGAVNVPRQTLRPINTGKQSDVHLSAKTASVSVPHAGHYSVNLFAANGRCIRKETMYATNNVTIHLEKYMPGCYLLVLEGEHFQVSRRLYIRPG